MKKKYLKYKNKYINLKNQLGGEMNICLKNISEIKEYNELEINIFDVNHLVVPQDHYYDLNQHSEDILVTTNFIDCVVLFLYNKNYGRYIAHYLKFNEFLDDLSDACEQPRKNFKEHDCLPTNDTYKPCENPKIKIRDSLPEWINDENTIGHILNYGEVYKVISRIEQIKQKMHNGKLNVYFMNGSKIQLNNILDDIKDFIPTDDRPVPDLSIWEYIKTICEIRKNSLEQIIKYFGSNEDFENIWNNQLPKSYYGIGMDKNGTMFFFNKTLEDLSYKPNFFNSSNNVNFFNFYNSLTVKFFASTSKSKKCIEKICINYNHYQSNIDNYKLIENEYKTSTETDKTNIFRQGIYNIIKHI